MKNIDSSSPINIKRKLLKQVENQGTTKRGKGFSETYKAMRSTEVKFFFAESDKEARAVEGRTQGEASMFCNLESLQHSDSEKSSILCIYFTSIEMPHSIKTFSIVNSLR